MSDQGLRVYLCIETNTLITGTHRSNPTSHKKCFCWKQYQLSNKTGYMAFKKMIENQNVCFFF